MKRMSWFVFDKYLCLFSLIIAFCFVIASLSSCGFTPNQVVRHPDAPMLITDSKDGYVRVSVYSKQENGLIDAGWVDLKTAQGWTIVKYDWEAFIAKKAKENENG